MSEGPPENLRDAQRTFTRARLCAAARELFFEQGFAATTMEQIAQAAGAGRTTLYKHFRDKDEVLAAIAEGYGAAMLEVYERLPGPLPSRQEIGVWVQEVAACSRRERAATALMLNLGYAAHTPPALKAMGERLLEALAQRLPAFRRAFNAKPGEGLVRGRGLAVILQLALACVLQTHDDPQLAADMLAVAAERFEQFVREEALDDADASAA